MKDTMSFYKTMKAQAPSRDIGLEAYCGFIKQGAFQDNVIEGRAHKSRAKVHHKTDPDYALYIQSKQAQECVTGSAVMNEGSKLEDNIKSMNGLIVIDIDTEVNESLINALRSDQYTRILHRSFGGDGICIFVRINQLKDFRDSFEGLAQYYLDNYKVGVDASCSNPNRLRYMSYDPDLYENEKSKVFTHKAKKKEPKPAELNFIYSDDDFSHILDQIKEKHIDLCEEDYTRYVRIGMGLANKFGDSGRDKFHFICSFGSKYNTKDTDRDFNGFVKSNSGKCSISTVYYYAKEAGLTLYSDKTKQMINRVKVAKSQGTPTVESITIAMANIHSVAVNEKDKAVIAELIKSKIDFSTIANEGDSEFQRLINFIVETTDPICDVINTGIYFNENDEEITDKEVNTLYLNANISLDFKVNKNDIHSVLLSDRIKYVNPLESFFKDNKHNEVGYIEQYARCIEPQSDYNVWAFKKWIVGMVHNWTAEYNDREVSPLTLVLTGKGGKGKSSFFRNMMPDILYKYHTEKKLNPKDKDDFFLLARCLMLIDEEFGGAVKDVKDYKAMSDANKITQRRPFGKIIENFKRRAGLGGNSNEKNIQRDVTGNRRILPINVTSIDYNQILEIDKVKLFVEAYNELKSPDFDWRIYKEEEIEYLRQNSEENEDVMPMEEIFNSYFSSEWTKKHTEKRVLNQGDLLNFLTLHSHVKPTKFELKDILTKQGLDYKLHDVGNQQKKKGIRLYVHQSTGQDFYNSRESDK